MIYFIYSNDYSFESISPDEYSEIMILKYIISKFENIFIALDNFIMSEWLKIKLLVKENYKIKHLISYKF